MVSCTHRSPSALEQHVNYSSMYQYIPAHTSTYWYILVCTCMYWYILVHTSTYWYEVISTGSGTYQYVLVCTCMTHKYAKSFENFPPILHHKIFRFEMKFSEIFPAVIYFATSNPLKLTSQSAQPKGPPYVASRASQSTRKRAPFPTRTE